MEVDRAKLEIQAKTAADRNGVPRDIFESLIIQESDFDPKAFGAIGEVGLTQLSPNIYKSLGVNPWDIDQNLDGGARFLKQLFNKYGNWRDALSHYNAGFNLDNGRGYADSVLARAVTIKPSDEGVGFASKRILAVNTPILDDLSSGVGVADVPELQRLKGESPEGFDIFKPSVMTGTSTAGAAINNAVKSIIPDIDFKSIIKKFGLWIIAIVFILIAIWQLSRS